MSLTQHRQSPDITHDHINCQDLQFVTPHSIVRRYFYSHPSCGVIHTDPPIAATENRKGKAEGKGKKQQQSLPHYCTPSARVEANKSQANPSTHPYTLFFNSPPPFAQNSFVIAILVVFIRIASQKSIGIEKPHTDRTPCRSRTRLTRRRCLRITPRHSAHAPGNRA